MARQLAPLDRSIAPIQMAHFVLRTRRLETLKAWYGKVRWEKADPIQELVQQGSA